MKDFIWDLAYNYSPALIDVLDWADLNAIPSVCNEVESLSVDSELYGTSEEGLFDPWTYRIRFNLEKINDPSVGVSEFHNICVNTGAKAFIMDPSAGAIEFIPFAYFPNPDTVFILQPGIYDFGIDIDIFGGEGNILGG